MFWNGFNAIRKFVKVLHHFEIREKGKTSLLVHNVDSE